MPLNQFPNKTELTSQEYKTFRTAMMKVDVNTAKHSLLNPAVILDADKGNNFALGYSSLCGHTELVWLLLRIDSVRQNATFENNYALLYAHMFNRIDIISMLLEIPAVRDLEKINLAKIPKDSEEYKTRMACLDLAEIIAESNPKYFLSTPCWQYGSTKPAIESEDLVTIPGTKQRGRLYS